jgi:hypothetical protein
VRPTDGGGPEPNWEQVPPTRNATCGMQRLRTGHSRAHLWKRKARGHRAPHAKLRVIVRSPTRWLVPPTFSDTPGLRSPLPTSATGRGTPCHICTGTAVGRSFAARHVPRPRLRHSGGDPRSHRYHRPLDVRRTPIPTAFGRVAHGVRCDTRHAAHAPIRNAPHVAPMSPATAPHPNHRCTIRMRAPSAAPGAPIARCLPRGRCMSPARRPSHVVCQMHVASRGRSAARRSAHWRLSSSTATQPPGPTSVSCTRTCSRCARPTPTPSLVRRCATRPALLTAS